MWKEQFDKKFTSTFALFVNKDFTVAVSDDGSETHDIRNQLKDFISTEIIEKIVQDVQNKLTDKELEALINKWLWTTTDKNVLYLLAKPAPIPLVVNAGLMLIKPKEESITINR